MGLLLIMSVPAIAIDMAGAVMTTSYLNFGEEQDHVLCVNTGMIMGEERIRGHFLLIPDSDSLQIMLRKIKLA
jgi:chemotaxis protein CheC